MKSKQTIDWKFGDKHLDYIKRCSYNNVNVAEGAVRAGKTIDNVLAFALELDFTEDKIHLATGSTVANAKLNIGEANGFGLEYIFRGRSRWGKFKSNECLYIQSVTGEKVVIFSGGGKADSYKSIRGNSYGLWIATEINLHHKSFIQEAINRTAMAKNRKRYWDLNPSPPRHWIYTEFINNYKNLHEKDEFPGGYNYEHFTIFDNESLTKERAAEIVADYDKTSIWYMRDILGKRMAAEGLIYEKYVEDPSRYRITAAEVGSKRYSYINIGIDFGGNQSDHAFVASGVVGNGEELIAIASEKHKPNLDTLELSRKVVDFTYQVIDLVGRVDSLYTDSAEQVLPRDIRREMAASRLGHIPVRDSTKHPIVDRIRATEILINQNRLKVSEDAKTLEEALCEAVYDEKKETEIIRLDDGTSDVDTLDAFEYSFAKQMKRLIRR